MIAYHSSVSEFYSDVNRNIIAQKVIANLPFSVGESEARAFQRSLPAVANALRNALLPLDARVAIEYRIPLTNRRVDFMIAGSDEEGRDHIIICELKQWDRLTHTDMKDVVLVGREEHVHPSWQAYSYGTTIKSFNEDVVKNEVTIHSCTFLHNYQRQYVGELCHENYAEGIAKAEPFISDQYEDLARFVTKYIKKKSAKDLFEIVDQGKIRPTKMLVDALANMLNGNQEYELIDEQRIVFSNLLQDVKARKRDGSKHVIIVRGGAGTGKSVIAISLMAELIKLGQKAFFVAKSSYVKENFYAKLVRGVPNHSFLRTLFMGSSSFIDAEENEFDVLVVDEAHRLTKRTKKSWFYVGENQIQEIIHASKISIFFIDETQNIDIKDYGTIENIKKAALAENAQIHIDDKYCLKSQFRCNGSDDYVAWLEAVLYNKPFVHSGNKVDYGIRVFDDIVEMKNAIIEANSQSNYPSRMLSGDVFEWKSMKDKNAIDIVIGDSFTAQWNKTKAFATDPRSIEEVGCIHTSQGMEFEYAGLIVADDLYYDGSEVRTDYTKHPNGAGEFKRPNMKKPLPEDAELIDRIIRNTYKVLFTRGQKGLFLYVMDEKLREYLKSQIAILLGTKQS